MEDRLNGRGPAAALAALGLILVVTVAWWLLALWPMASTAPSWLLRTREVCFGSPADGLPTAGGWVILVGEPVGMVATLLAIAGRELRAGFRWLASRLAGRLTLAVGTIVIVVGLAATARRVAAARLPAEPADPRIATVDRAMPAFRLVDQRGDTVGPEQLEGRAVLFAFAFGHCVAVCPATVERVRQAIAATDGSAVGVIVTVDPWREPPERLAALADQWRLGQRIHLLSGPVDTVAATLTRFGVRTFRDTLTGEVTHSSLAQIASRDGRVRYLVSSTSPAVTEALRRAVR